ncbi:hypothetical protein [Rhodovibrio salinarum]|uniref:Uncharacterized protein n=1 Tax=Rhodovibrio salinarum TaxID=1087 RepID=A0A934QIN9_9PROT|nr:hypothetical protein [Rhodovibrio salinarum]MBK1697155.1 hypothetical protein [Rhodovibrio salinarum]
MPSERRLIRFTTPEVEQALRTFAEAHERTLPRSQVASIEYDGQTEEGVSARIKFENVPRPTHFTALEMTAALIAYCHKTHVPIPKQGQKSLYKAKGNVILQIDVKSR